MDNHQKPKRSIALDRRIQYYPSDVNATRLLKGLTIEQGSESKAVDFIVMQYVNSISPNEKERLRGLADQI